jgi:hypothetical protein
MADTQIVPGPEDDIKEVVRAAQIGRLMAYLVDNRITSLAEGCRDLGLNPRTVKRWLSRPENANLLTEFKKRELDAAVQTAVSSLAEVVAKQADLAMNARSDRDKTKAASWLLLFLDTYGNLIPQGANDEGVVKATFRRTFTLEGPMTVVVGQKPKDES